MVTPVTSLGRRSGVNWIRLLVPWTVLASMAIDTSYPAIPAITGIIAMLIGSHFADRLLDKRRALSGLLVLGAIGWFAMGYWAASAWALLAVCLIEIAIGIARPMFWTVPPLFLSGEAMAGAIALISIFANFGGILGPVVIGWLKTTTNSFSGGLYYVAGCALFAAIAIFVLRTTPRAAPAYGE